MTAVDETGRVVFVADDPKYIEALEQTTLWWTELGVQMPTYSSGDLGSAFRNGRAAMNFGISAFNLPELLENMTDEWGLVPFPMGPSTDRHHWTVQALNTTVIPANAADPEALAALRAFLWREEDISINDFLAAHVNSQEAADVLLTANREWKAKLHACSRLSLAILLHMKEKFSRDSGAQLLPWLKSPIIQANLDDLFSQ